MKNLTFFFLALTVVFTSVSFAGEPGKIRLRDRDDGYWERKNIIGAGLAGVSFNGNGSQGLIPVTVSYDRQLKHNITVGGLVHVVNHFYDLIDDGYVVDDRLIFAGIRTGYDLKVARNIRLRFGVGAGLGYHRISDVNYGCLGMEIGQCGAGIPNYPATRLLPHMSIDIHWVFRVGRSLEMMFAPLLFSPSQLIFAPWGNDFFRGGYYNFSVIPVRLCVRF